MEGDALISFDNLARVLNDYGQAVIDTYRKTLAEYGKDTRVDHPGSLQRDMRFTIDGGANTFGGASFEVLLHLPPHWYNVEFGRKPCPPSRHWVPVDALLRWIEVKPILPRPDANGRIPTPRQLAFLINRAINDPDRRGTDPPRPGIAKAPILAETLEEVNARFETLIAAAVSADLSVFLKTISFSDFSTRGRARSNVVRGPHRR